MRKALIILTCMLAIGLYARSAGALTLTFDDSLGVGWVDPCASGMAAAVAACIDNLITVSPKGGDTFAGTAHAGAVAGQTDAMTDGDDVSELLDKDFPRRHLWLTSGLTGGAAIAASVSAGDELTHSSPVGTAADPVPDGGATAALLGFALAAIRLLKPRFV